MHRSRLAGFIIDSQVDDLDAGAAFWSQALGYGLKSSKEDEDAGYKVLDTGPGGLHVELQKVAHESRVHLDIESDDVEAEVLRLEKLGAVRIKQIRTWWVMQAPTGHRFCVVRAKDPDFAAKSNRWSDDHS